MNIGQIQIDFLTKFNELTSLQCIKSTDLEKINPSKMDKNRIVSRVLTSDIGINKYESRTSDENYRYFNQINVNRLTLTFNFLSDYDKVLLCHNFFNHLGGSKWWNDRAGTDYVIEDVTSIVDLSDTIDADYREKYNFDIIIRISDSNTEKIELIKDVDFNILVKNN
ncbi:hypothetical protein [uncultured Ilyobacter sp.]|uniref:phage neck terminator protein n=1 Tax=uncultured Ilyobacter sp. TaxID=544433 RepID=UPI0029C63450|nr:hypothetical protein [uncultured Ilyobacter sp.]